jgi:hypothetical protein
MADYEETDKLSRPAGGQREMWRLRIGEGKAAVMEAGGLIFALTKNDELVITKAIKTGYMELGRINPGIKLGLQQQPTIFAERLYIQGNDTIVCYQMAQDTKSSKVR